MTRDARERLSDIKEAVESIQAHVGGSLEAPDVTNAVILHAVLFNFVVIGEAAKSIGDELRSASPEIRWADLAGLRDIIAHQYFRIQKQIIENTIRHDLPTLKLEADRLLGEE